jgi:LPXTG-site transpeptidase (sortase) family protein
MVLAKTISGTAEESNEPLPSRLVIPKLGIDADVQHLGVTPHGLMAAPKNFTDVSWYKLGTVPGARGSAVMAGHEDNAISLDGVFKHLDELEVGDEVRVVRQDGSALRFRVIKKEIQPYNLTGPTLSEIFTRSDGRYLNLITCAGEWLPEAHTNDRRLIVYTELVS